jgi:predicted nucleic acid-binding protein
VIFLDANLFLRFLTQPTDHNSRRFQQIASDLLHDIRAGAVEASTSELVIHEVCFVLTSKRQYGLSHDDAIRMLRPILRFNALKFSPGDKRIILRGFEIWERNPRLEFADSVIAARCEANGWELATFDEDLLGTFPTITRWRPESG